MPATQHQRHFQDLSPDDFERLVYWLAKRSSDFDEVQWYGGARDKGRDVVAYKHTTTGREKWYIQAKRYQRITFATLREELDKLAEHAEDEPSFAPQVIVFATACPVPPQSRDRAAAHAQEKRLPQPYYWDRLYLDERLKAQPEIQAEFFGVDSRHPPLISSQAIAAHRAALRLSLESDAQARWGGMSLYIQEAGAALPIEASPYATGRLGPRQNLLQVLHDAGRLLVLGDPGSGKTVALERLAWELCAAPDSTPTVPVLLRLFHYAGTPLETWVRSLLQGTGHLRLDDDLALAAFLKQADVRCAFLFDGLNEVAPPYRDRLVDELVRWSAAHPRHPLILTSRAQDELWRRLRSEIGQVIVVQPIEDDQAQAYLVAHLGQVDGQALYARLDPRLQEMARMPLILWLIKEAGAAEESVPGNRGELYARFVSRMLRRDTDRRMDAEIPERAKRQALAGLAYSLGLEQRLTSPRDEALDIVAGQLGAEQADAVVGACARHGLFAGEDPIWFAPHQTVQEHFAALALRDLAAREWKLGAWPRLRLAGQRLLSGRQEGLAALAADDWWMETFVQLAGLVEDADRLARDVAQANPWLAWWCVEEGREVSEATRVWVEDRSVRLLSSDRVADRRRAVQTLAQIQNERPIDPLFHAAADSDAEIAGLAVQALLERGEAVRNRALTLAREPKSPLHPGVLAYLSVLLGLPVAYVPPGPFEMGSDKEKDGQAFDHEFPQHEFALPGYWIGRYPVTVAQFRAFVKEDACKLRGGPFVQGRNDHPVTDVSWHDAVAYCSWLRERTGLPVTLPSEAQWEKAARGVDGRVYPWGNEPSDKSRCNFNGDLGRTTPVGQYSPAGDSPYGCADMAGNVWEWTRSLFKDYPYDLEDGRESVEAGNERLRVVRGGSFYSSLGGVRCASRLRDGPVSWVVNIGFRVVVAPVASDPLIPSALLRAGSGSLIRRSLTSPRRRDRRGRNPT